MENNVIILADLTALYSVRGRFRKNIDYKAVDSFIKHKMNVELFTKDSMFFTLYNQMNPGQNNFIKLLRDEIGWNVVGVKNSEIRSGIDYKQYRFDAKISYELGSLLQPESLTKILVISDSFELASPMVDVADDYNVEMTLGFFSDALDGRWYKILQDPKNKINLLDFELMQSHQPKEQA